MKVLYLTPGCFDKGGISRYSRYQITALRELFGKERVKVYSLLGPEKDSFEEPFSVDWHLNGNTKLNQIRYIWRTFFTLLFWRPNVVHIAHVNFSGFAVFCARVLGVKSVLNVYGLEVWSGLSKDAAYGLKKVDSVISDCNFTADYIEQHKLRNTGRIITIWDCVDLEKFYPAPFNKGIIHKYSLPDPGRYFVILSLGRLSKSAAHKGYDRLIKAFSLLEKKNPDARLVIAGKGDNRSHYEHLAETLGVSGKVFFPGMVEDNDLADVYRCAAVFSLVSDRGMGRGEGIPLTPLEAMACGAAIIVGNHDGSQEAVFQDSNGYVIDPFDLEKHVELLETLANEPAILLEKRKYAGEVARMYFSYDGFRDKHMSFYQQFSS